MAGGQQLVKSVNAVKTVDEVGSRFWSWVLVRFLKLNFGPDFEAKFGNCFSAGDRCCPGGGQAEPCWSASQGKVWLQVRFTRWTMLERDGNIKYFFRRTAKGKPRTGAWGRSPLPSECSWSRSTLKTCAVQITKSFLGGIKVASHFTFLKRGENWQ